MDFLTSLVCRPPRPRAHAISGGHVNGFGKLLMALGFALAGVTFASASAPNVYVTPDGSSQGACNGLSHPASWFNSSSNWGSSASQIGPGTTIHLCGTFAAPLTFQGGGSASAPVTLFFESNAKFSAPHWGNGSNVISSNGN